MAHPDVQQAGLKWVQTTFSIEPQWTVEINLDSVKHEIEEALGTQGDITFLAQGAFNKLYTVQTASKEYVMRVSLPVDPQRKTASEVATIAWIRQNTTIPVPEIITFKDYVNIIGFEWMLMTKIPGKTLSSTWRSISLDAKQGIVRQLATHSSALFDKQREGIGNLYFAKNSRSSTLTSTATSTSNRLGEIVSLEFLWGNRSKYGVSRGPFQSSKDWLTARLLLIEKEYLSVIEDPKTDECDLEDANEIITIVQKLRQCLDLVFKENLPEFSMLHHDDLTKSNILVDDNSLSGVIDWECVSWVPLWKACYYPTFLMPGRTRTEEPDCNRYERDNDEPAELYWEHLMEYELTLLRTEFLSEMQRLQPGWVRVFKEHTLQRSLDFAISNCDYGFATRFINEWIDNLMANGTDDSPHDLYHRYFAE